MRAVIGGAESQRSPVGYAALRLPTIRIFRETYMLKLKIGLFVLGHVLILVADLI